MLDLCQGSYSNPIGNNPTPQQHIHQACLLLLQLHLFQRGDILVDRRTLDSLSSATAVS